MTPHVHREGLAYKSGPCECGLYLYATLGGYTTRAPSERQEYVIRRYKDGKLYDLRDPRGRA